MLQIFLVVVMFIMCMVLHTRMVLDRPGRGFLFFLFWIGVCGAVSYFLDPSVGIGGFISYLIVVSVDDEVSPSRKRSSSGSAVGRNVGAAANSGSVINPSAHSGSSYHSGGKVAQLPNGNSAVREGNVTYISNGIRSVKEGKVTYFLDDNTGKRLGRGVDIGNGVTRYFDDDGREIGHSYTNGSITDYFGDCFKNR